MGSKLRKNAIMTGYIHSYCLVCECYFDSDEETSDHVWDTSHIDKLLAYPYLEKYGDNHIRKVNKGYFCEFCSELFATAAKVSLHVKDSTHYNRKGTLLLHRPSGQSAVIAFDNILISERAWHSFSEDTCAICSEEFDDESTHKTDPAHLLTLVQNQIEFGPENSVYRKTDDSSFQCLTCNAVFAFKTLDEHFTNADHKNLYSQCQDEFKKYTEQNKTKGSENTKEGSDRKDDVKYIIDDVIDKKDDVEDKKDDVEDKKDDVKDRKDDLKNNDDDVKERKDDINDKKGNVKKKKESVKSKKAGAKDKKANKNNQVKENSDANAEKKLAIPTHTQPDRDREEINHNTTIAKLESDEATVFANGNNLKYEAGKTSALCQICETKLPASLHSMKEHVNGKEHKNRLGRMNHAAKFKANVTKLSLARFVIHRLHVKALFHEDMVINAKYCISLASFVLLTWVPPRYRCQLCEVSVPPSEFTVHCESRRHFTAMSDTPVITSLPNLEFVREARAGVFHCGYCNLIVPRWEQLACHLQSREHQENKDACSWRLRRHVPHMARAHVDENALGNYMLEFLSQMQQFPQ